jgi:Arc/MetJ family transcription regulator
MSSLKPILGLGTHRMCMENKFHTHSVGFMRTNIVIDDDLIKEAMALSNIKTKKAVVEFGLKLLVQIKRQEQIKNLRGKLRWNGDLEAMRLDQ